jgi:hypothetical protein
MTGASLLALLPLLGLGSSPDPVALSRQLGSPRFSERQEAAAALEALGDEALPALRGARTAQDPEVRSRAAVLADAIERRRLLRPTRVRLDFRDQPPEEVIRALADRSGIPLRLIPGERPVRLPGRITLLDPAPIPFWEALDRLCHAAGLQPSLGVPPPIDGRSEAPGLLLQPGPPLRFLSDHGPFRVWAVRFHHQRDLVFDREPADPAPPAADEQFFLQLQVLVEPRLWVRQAGPVRRLVALDDRGQTLVPGGRNGPDDEDAFGVYDGLGQETVLPLTIPLRHPGPAGRSIKTLRGSVPVVVSARTPDPLVIPLAGAAGKTFRAADASLTIHEVNDDPMQPRATVDLTVRNEGRPEQAVPGSPEFFGNRAPEMVQNRIEILDARGKVLQAFPTRTQATTGETRMTLMILPADGGVPTHIRYYDLARATAEATFEFTGIPIP